MASQEANGRLQEIIKAWPKLPEAAREVIHMLAMDYLDTLSYKALGAAAKALATRESPDTESATP